MDKDELIKSLQKAIDTHAAAAFANVPAFAAMMMDNPRRAIDQITDIYDRALDQAYTDKDGENNRAFVQSIAGGPFEMIPWGIYNSVGAAYPYLTRDERDYGLQKILGILDTRNYLEVNGDRGAGHTTGIREPMLLADIKIARWLYWPGLDEGKYLIKEFGTFFDFQKDLIDEEGIFRHKATAHEGGKITGVNSDFLVAYSLLRSDFCDWGKDYLKIVNPNFLERTLKGICAIRFGITLDGKNPLDETETEKGRKRLFELLPKSVHERIDPIRQERDWVDYAKFNLR